MAHLTIHLGGPVVVPFRFPPRLVPHSRSEFSARGVRWKALREAASVAEGLDVIGAMRLPRTARAAPHKGASK